MSIRLDDKYPGKVTPADANYQDGSIRNETTPDVSDDGTPLDFEWGNDFEGLKQRLILMSGIIPSDSSDTSLGGDILDALFGEASPFKVQPTYPATMTVKASKGSMGGATVAEQTSSTMAAPAVNPRIDVIVVDQSTGVISVITGAEAASPVSPAIPGDKRGIAQITLVVSQTTIVDSDITDIRQVVKGPSTSDITAATITPASDANVTLTEAEYTADRQVLVDGSWASGHDIIVPDESRLYLFDNTAGTYSAQVKTAAGAGVAVPSGASAILICDATDVLDPLPSPALPLFHIQDQKPSGTAGGTATSGAFQTRVFNTVLTNEISGASLSVNQVTLPAGTYEFEGYALAYKVDGHKITIHNVTDATVELVGSSSRTAAGNNVNNPSFVSGRVILAATKVLELQHRPSTTRATDGWGQAASSGVVEVFSDLKIRKVL